MGADMKFGRIALRRDSRQVFLDGKPAPVGGRAFDLLARLLAAPDEVVTKSQLMDAVWPGLAVVENNLNAQVKALRQALGDKAILTVPGRGYRLGPLSLDGDVSAEQANNRASIAILPFDNMSGDPEQAYFVDGVAEEILTALAAFKQLQVIARNSSFAFKNRPTDVREVGRRLGVRYVLEGSVRRAADRVRITAQLIETRKAPIFGPNVSKARWRMSSVCRTKSPRASWRRSHPPFTGRKSNWRGASDPRTSSPTISSCVRCPISTR